MADVAVVHSAWSEIASCTVFNPVMDKFVDEYCGWCQFLGDTIHTAPACTTTIRLPAEWRGPGVQVSYATPEQPVGSPLEPLTGDAAVFDPAAGTLRLRTPNFTTYMLVFCHQAERTAK